LLGGGGGGGGGGGKPLLKNKTTCLLLLDRADVGDRRTKERKKLNRRLGGGGRQGNEYAFRQSIVKLAESLRSSLEFNRRYRKYRKRKERRFWFSKLLILNYLPAAGLWHGPCDWSVRESVWLVRQHRSVFNPEFKLEELSKTSWQLIVNFFGKTASVIKNAPRNSTTTTTT